MTTDSVMKPDTCVCVKIGNNTYMTMLCEVHFKHAKQVKLFMAELLYATITSTYFNSDEDSDNEK